MESTRNCCCGSSACLPASPVDFVPLIKFLWLVSIEMSGSKKAIKYFLFFFFRLVYQKNLLPVLKNSTDTPEDYWCQVPELENFTANQRRLLSIPLIEVSID